jgi:hypothetical protein
VNAVPSNGTVAGTSVGYTAYSKNGSGDMDFIAANGGSSPSFYWYYLLGASTVTPEMYLDTGANLHVPNGSISSPVIAASINLSSSVHTVATLTSATSAGAGGIEVVSDGNGTAGVCTGGGSTYMIAVSNGSAWQCR